MDKFCGNCGNKLAAEETFCGQCGAKVEDAPVAAEAAEKKSFDIGGIVDKVMDFVNGIVEKVKSNPAYIAIAGVAAVVVIALILFLSFGLGGPEDKAFKNYVDVVLKGNAKKIETLAPAEYWDYLEDEEDVDIDDVIDEFEEGYEMTQEFLEEEYGDNIKISYKITDKKELSDKKLDKIADGLKENYDIAKKSVKAAYEIEADVKIKGSDDDDEDELTIIVAKIGNKWYPVSESGYLLIG